MGSPCGGSAIRIDFRHTETYHGGKTPDSQHAEQMGKERFIAVPAEVALMRPCLMRLVEDGCRRNHQFAFYRRLEERWMKADDFASICAGAFRKEQDRHGLGQPVAHAIGDLPGADPADPIHKDRATKPRQPAKTRPCSNLMLGDKGRRHCRAADGNVQVAQVIGYDERSARGQLALDAIANAYRGQHNPAAKMHPLRPLHRRDAPAVQPHPHPHASEAQVAERQADDKHHAAANTALRSPPTHRVSGARKRFRADDEIVRRSIHVRKSMVPNSLSHAGALQMRAPIAR
jgi:hypothetical protein